MRVELLVRDRAEIKLGIVDGSSHFGVGNVHESIAMHSMDSVFLVHVEFVPYVQAGGRLAKLDQSSVVDAMVAERQFSLKSLVDEGLKEKFIFSANKGQVDQLSVVINMVRERLG
ncbi:hypothetical protein [Vibrio parahaemolyticus]|uniref:hypothetical protein n=1 Tax=Vibrio parahaemolyticus TaxID=670 RepID=UPI000B2533F7|nr:hypothetical protein [Vibrio parahaemolyticus]